MGESLLSVTGVSLPLQRKYGGEGTLVPGEFQKGTATVAFSTVRPMRRTAFCVDRREECPFEAQWRDVKLMLERAPD